MVDVSDLPNRGDDHGPNKLNRSRTQRVLAAYEEPHSLGLRGAGSVSATATANQKAWIVAKRVSEIAWR